MGAHDDDRVAAGRAAARRARARRLSGEPPTPLEAAAAAWRWLRRMRTALYLLAALGLATLLATIIPQAPNVPDVVDRWLVGSEGPGAGVAAALRALGLFDVYGSPWFAVLLALLFTSLTACLIPRYRAFLRTVRHGVPPRTRAPEEQAHVAHFATDASAEETLAEARRLLGRRRFRLRPDDVTPAATAPVRADARRVVVPAPADEPGAPTGGPQRRQVAAERGHIAREGGSLAFHTAFFLLLVAIVAGQLLGFRGHVGVVEGASFTDTPVGYWANLGGRLWDDDWHRGFVFTLDEFEVDWTEQGQPERFVSHFTVAFPDDRADVRGDLRVNDPRVIDGMKIHQLDWGYAVRVVVRDGGEVVHDAFVPLRVDDEGLWRGAVKAPAADPGVGLELVLVPTAPEGEDGRPTLTAWPAAEAPLLVFRAWEGDLQLERVQGIHDLDTTRMVEVDAGGLRPGTETELRDGTAVAFPELRHWSGLQVSHRPTDPLLLLAAGLIVAALLPALYAYRRRIWVDVVEDASRGVTLVTVAGQALQRPQALEGEHRSIATTLRDRLHGRDVGVTTDGEPRRPRDDRTSSEVVRR